MKHKGKFFAIPGNHDLLHNNLGMLEKTTIGSLALTGALNLKFEKFKIDNVEFQASLVMKNFFTELLRWEFSTVIISVVKSPHTKENES